MTALMLGVLAGFVVSIPPGPVTATVIARSVDIGRRIPADLPIHFACGVALCEVLYAAAAFFGTGLLLPVQALELVNMIGFALILVLGIRYSFFDLAAVPLKEEKAAPVGSLVLGLILPLSTPTIGLSYVIIAGLLHTNAFVHDSTPDNTAVSLGAGIGTFLWLVTLAIAMRKLKENAGMNLVRVIGRAAGVFLLATAAYLGHKLALSPS